MQHEQRIKMERGIEKVKHTLKSETQHVVSQHAGKTPRDESQTSKFINKTQEKKQKEAMELSNKDLHVLLSDNMSRTHINTKLRVNQKPIK